MELVFDAAFGELFIIRVAGNVLGPAIAGTLQYAGTHLHTPLFIVLGHEGCGAVEANVRWTLRELLESPEGKARLAQGDVKLIGAVYDLVNGRVRFLE